MINAAHAAASWVRARRAAWSDEPASVAFAGVDDATSIDIESGAPAAIVETPVPVPLSAREPEGPSLATRVMDSLRPLREPLVRWVPRLAAAAIVIALAGASLMALTNWIRSRPAAPPAAAATRAPATAPAAAPARPATTGARGGLDISSTPAGAEVLVDGQRRGVTPLTLNDITPGRHTVELKGADGTVRRTVTVAAGKTGVIDESIFAGWLVVDSPFEVTVSEGSRVLRADDRNQIMLPPGRHELRLANRTLGYEEVKEIELKPGAMLTVSVTPPRSAITVTANEPADVWVDGARAGDAPLSAFPVDLGTHNIVVKRAAGGERRVTATVTTKPFTLEIDFNKP